MVNKPLLVTGGTSGLGLQIARALSAEYRIVNLGRSAPPANHTDIFSDHVHVDLSGGYDVIKTAVSEVKSKWGGVSGFVGCAGLQKIAPIKAVSETDLVNLMAVNAFANVHILKALMRLAMLGSGSSVVLISSIASSNPEAGLAAYSMTKAALDAFTAVAAIEFASRGIRVNSVRPGLIETPLIAAEKAYTREKLSLERSKYPLGLGVPSDVVGLVKFLLSPGSSWITGQAFTIDGGRVLT